MTFFRPRKIVALFAMLAGSAMAQTPLRCTAQPGVPPIARADGVAEEIGQVLITCLGGSPTSSSTENIPTINLQIFLNTNVTSRLLDSIGGRSEALLLIDEPVGAEQVEARGVPNTDAVKASGNGTYKTPGLAGRPTVFGAEQVSANSLVWRNIPFDPPGDSGNRTLRLVNIRANASQLGVGMGLIPNQISMVLAFSGAGTAYLSSPQVTVAFVQPAMQFSATSATYDQCNPGTKNVTLTFTELFGAAFRHQRSAGDQNVPGAIYNSESMFYSSAFTGIGAGAGIASHGTRLSARFSNVPANVSITVPASVTSDPYSTVTPGVPNSNDGAALVALGTDGSTANQSTGVVGLSGGAGTAVWEVNRSNPGAISSLKVVVSVTHGVTPPPELNLITVAGSFAPVASTVNASTEGAPRFSANPQTVAPFTLAGCTGPGVFYLSRNTVSFIGPSIGPVIIPTQAVTVFTGAGVGAWSATSDSPWLGVAPVTGQNNDGLTAFIKPSGYPAPGTYTGKITVSASGATVTPVVLNCTLVVTAAGGGQIVTGITRVSGDGQIMTGYGLFKDALVVRLADAAGNPIAGRQVTWSGPSEVALLDGPITTTDSNGLAQVRAHWSQVFPPSVAFLQFAITAASDIGNTVFHLILFPLGGSDFPSRPQIEMTTPTQPNRTFTVKVGTKSDNAIGVSVFGGGGTIPQTAVPNVALNISTDPTAGIEAICEGGTPLTGSNGYAWCNLTARGRVGLWPLHVNVGDHTSFTGVQVNVTPGDPVAPAVQQGNEQSGMPGATLPSTLVVRIYDDYGNPLPATPVAWTIMSAGTATLVNAATQADSNGYASAQVRLGSTPGRYQVKVATGGKETVFAFTVQAPAAVSISLNRTALAFGAAFTGSAVTTPQDVFVGMTGGMNTWTAASSSAWLAVSPAAGQGNGKFSVSLVKSALPSAGSSAYTGTITVTAAGATNGPLIVNCTLTVKSTTTAPFGSYDTPVDGLTGVSGSIAVTGWALDDIGVKKVTIWRDPVGPELVHPNGYVYIGDAMFVAGARPDVETKHRSTPNAYRAGWGYMMLTYGLPKANGTFRIHAIATDEEGNPVTLGTRTITVDNAHSVKPFGALDAPFPGETISGTLTNTGWALTPQPASIAANGSTIWVHINGVNVANPLYGFGRGDIATYFAGYANSNAAGGTYALDTTKYANAMHAIAWVVSDNQGHTDGIGSRYFYTQNTIAAAGADPVERDYQLRSARLRRPAAQAASYPAFRQGYERDSALTAIRQAGEGLLEPVELKELDRVELHLAAGQQWTAALRVGDELRELPVGSTFDAEGGIFYWQLGAGFLGEYMLEFHAPDGTVVPVAVQVGGGNRSR